MRDSAVIYRSFFEAIKELPPTNQAEVWNAIFEYSLNFNEVEINGLSKTIFTLIKPQLAANIKKFHNGNKQKISKPEATEKQDISKTEGNVNDNVNVNAKENVIPKGIKTNLSVNWEGLLSQFNEITGKKLKVVDDKAKRQFIARLKDGYTKADIVSAITNCYNSEFHQSNGHKNLTLEFISRPDKFAMYFDFKETAPKPKKEDRL